jgi:hypothetical protein
MYTIQLDPETADRIAVTSMKNYLDSLTKSLNGEYWVHPNDIEENKKRIEALKLILSDYPND